MQRIKSVVKTEAVTQKKKTKKKLAFNDKQSAINW